MVMGKTHALSGSAAALAAITIYNLSATSAGLHPVVALMGTIITAGAALAPDIDSRSSTVVRSFGIFGVAAYHIANTVSVTIHSATRARKDKAVENGHRTFFHTTAMALIAGALTTLLTLPTNPVDILGRTYTLGELNALIIMGIFLNLSFAGLFEKQIKKARKSFGPYILMLASFGLAVGVGYLLPEEEYIAGAGTYAWLGIAVAFGWFIHLLGDAITKMGVPLAWPFKINGRRWWDVTLPAFMRIRADGAVERTFLFPLFAIATVALFAYNCLAYFGVF